MKPNFALTLSFEGIGLLHRTFSGWHLVGEAALDSPDLIGELAVLRDKARALDPTGLRSKMVIPDSQIKYMEFDADGMDETALAVAVRNALDGSTPYKIDELVYDWSVADDRVYVAAVARETLDEAEKFGADHGFGPVSFVAMPEDGVAFEGEPFFGETRHAAGLLGKGERVDRDISRIRIVGAAHMPESPALDAMDAPVPPAGKDLVPDPQAPHRADAPDARAGKAATPDQTAPEEPAPPAEEPAKTPVAFASRRQPGDGKGGAPALGGATRGAPALPKTSRFSVTAAAEKPAPETDKPAPESDGTAPAEGGKDSARPKPSSALNDRAARLAAADDAPETPAPSARPAPDDAAATAGASLRPDPAAGATAAPGLPRTSFISRRKSRPLVKADKTSTLRPVDPQAEAAFAEKQRMTIFGAREETPREAPRFLALILTAVLLLFLVGVAAWASIFLDEGLTRFFLGSGDVRTATVPDDARGAGPDMAADPDGEAVELAALQDADPETGLPDALATARPAELTPEEARARYAVTGIWQLAPEPSEAPGSTTLEDVYHTSIDRAVDIGDAVALPDPRRLRSDAYPQPMADPPPPGSEYPLDERGFVEATPDGTLTPDGVMVIAGRPPLVPPRAPPRAAPEPEPDVMPAVAQTTGIRPRPRPDDLAEQMERTAFAGRTRAELAQIRPRVRPQSAQEAAEAAAAAAADSARSVTPGGVDISAIDGAVEEAAAATDPLAGATPQAVSISLKPKTRPRNFARIVQKSQEEVEAQPVSASQRMSPNIPTTASVARAATQKNMIALRKVNLIGVYGKPGSRRALVRLANGRYKKVKVGDRLDGGKVAAIGDSELRYVKRGRNVTLKMPRG